MFGCVTILQAPRLFILKSFIRGNEKGDETDDKEKTEKDLFLSFGLPGPMLFNFRRYFTLFRISWSVYHQQQQHNNTNTLVLAQDH